MFTNMIAITVQNTMAKLGPLPNEHGDMVKDIMCSKDRFTEIMALGLCMEDCQKVGSYEPLDALAKAIEDRKKKSENPV